MSALFATQLSASSDLPETSMDVSNAPSAAMVSGIDLTYLVAAGIILAAVFVAAAAFWIDTRKKERST